MTDSTVVGIMNAIMCWLAMVGIELALMLILVPGLSWLGLTVEMCMRRKRDGRGTLVQLREEFGDLKRDYQAQVNRFKWESQAHIQRFREETRGECQAHVQQSRKCEVQVGNIGVRK